MNHREPSGVAKDSSRMAPRRSTAAWDCRLRRSAFNCPRTDRRRHAGARATLPGFTQPGTADLQCAVTRAVFR